MNSGNVKVSVIIITYNHEKYIAQAIESVLLQRNVSFEIIIGDDASTDHTPEIVKAYARKYPNLIRAFLREKNLGPTRNAYECLKYAQGKYIAACEGDDFWCDTDKLRKQADFLDCHDEYSAVASDIYIVDENGIPWSDMKKLRWISKRRDYRLRDFRGIFLPGHPNSLMRRNFYLDKSFESELIWRADPYIGDRTTALQWVCRGRIYRIDEKLSCYRCVRTNGHDNLTSFLFGGNIDYERELNYTSVLEKYAMSQTGKKVYFDYHRAEMLLSALKTGKKSDALLVLHQIKRPIMLPVFFVEIVVSRIKEMINNIHCLEVI